MFDTVQIKLLIMAVAAALVTLSILFITWRQHLWRWQTTIPQVIVLILILLIIIVLLHWI
ncbi:MAG: hypothetical protein H9901_01125 [Candidatus Paralactobacillus gallistercoris]|uniref:Uncharacterized protein n=1 Tax=Candidatus Paralactobacillus gallistercoris TaxID=2838724 RepID=A0A948TIM3_9LACO|nr:hypothetical protein [Candidatus Paralactobacillus gallistercoris]